MRSKKSSIKSSNSINPSSFLESNLSFSTGISSKLSNQLLTYYKSKCDKLEKDYESLLDFLDQVKAACDLSHELQREFSEKNNEISKLQEIIGDLQIHLFREKEKNLKLSAENNEFKIQDIENKKRIKALLMITGMCERKFLHFITTCSQDKFIEPQLPTKLQKLKEDKEKELIGVTHSDEKDNVEFQDPQTLILKNQLLTSQLENHIKLSKDQIDVLINEKEISHEERTIERQRLQKEIDFLSTKLKQTQDILCETTGKLVKLQQLHEKEKTMWMEEKDRYAQTLSVLKDKEGIELSDIMGYCVNGVGNRHRQLHGANSLSEKEQIVATYKKRILALELEVNMLREKSQVCRSAFKEKTEMMTAQVSHLKKKYEDLDRRRLLEAEGFRTDIRMLRQRVKELEKKLSKVSDVVQSKEQKQLLVSARYTLNRAKLLEQELAQMKTKILTLEPTRLSS